jgi:ATP-dependent DNA helicase RecG
VHTAILDISRSVTALPGVGAERARLLEKLGVTTVHDLLLHAPRKYEDRRAFSQIADIKTLGPVTAEGEVVEVGVKRFGRGTKSLSVVIIDDGTGRLHCRWWNLPHIARSFQKGQRLLVSGRLRELKPRTTDHPDVEVMESADDDSVHAKRIVPIYPLTEGVQQRWLRTLVWRALQCRPELPDKFPKELFLARPGYAEAIQNLHFPGEMHQVKAARERLALEEFIELQLEIQLRRRHLENKAPRLICPGDNHLIKKFLPTLGYELTAAQTAVLREIRQDLARGIPMRRLLQGDVGSGKTVVAACSTLMAIESGKNVALMAPTEILAEQHFKNFTRWFAPLEIPVKIWTGGSKSDLSGGPELFAGNEEKPLLVIGTHALIQRSFNLPNLGLVIIDEQHRFGVSQREQFVKKGQYPHLLVMTATPIPRTLGLTLYGDLDISLLDEMPAGRKPVKTYIRTEDKLPKVWEFVRDRLAKGEQAYVVYSRVENDSSAKAALKELENIRAGLSTFRVEPLHGKLSALEKEQLMTEFVRNRIQVLVASSVIEVGLDVPNATVIVIENAEQFGLAQLHQLRGRVGRGAKESYCILISAAKNEQSAERLKVLEQTTDGFKIAEADLKFRGPGELLGQEQSGMPKFRFGDLQSDFELIVEARQIAKRILEKR